MKKQAGNPKGSGDKKSHDVKGGSTRNDAKTPKNREFDEEEDDFEDEDDSFDASYSDNLSGFDDDFDDDDDDY